MKPSHIESGNLIDRTRQVWQPRTQRELSCEDARQITVNITGFFALLAEWARAEMPFPTNDTGKAVTSDDEEVPDEP